MSVTTYTFTNGFDYQSGEYSFIGGTFLRQVGDVSLVKLKKEWGGRSGLALFILDSDQSTSDSLPRRTIVGTSSYWWIGKKQIVKSTRDTSIYILGESPARAVGDPIPFVFSQGEKIVGSKANPENLNNLYSNFGRFVVPAGSWSTEYQSSPVWITESLGRYTEYWYTSFSGKYRPDRAPIFNAEPSLRSRNLNRSQIKTAEVVYNSDLNGDGVKAQLSFNKSTIYNVPNIPFSKPYVKGLKMQIDNPFSNDETARWVKLDGGPSDEVLIGSKYIDFIQGGSGDDIIYGGDRYGIRETDPFFSFGNAGVEQYGGANDVLTGGRGKDTFILNIANLTWITDFNPSQDKILLYSEVGNGVGGSITTPPPSFDEISLVDTGGGALELLAPNNIRFTYLQGFALSPSDLNQKIQVFS